MKSMIINYITVLLTITFIGCSKDFLDRPPLDSLTDETYYQNDNEVLMGTALLYSLVWGDYNDKCMYALGDGRAGNIISNDRDQYYQFTVTASDWEVHGAWRALYNVIGQCNMAIRNIKTKASNDVSVEIKRHAIAEARFMRGVAYSMLVMNWGPVPIVYSNIDQMLDTALAPNTVESIWALVIRDLRYSVQNLPETPADVGRISRWSAKGMLAKMYLYRSGLSSTSEMQLYRTGSGGGEGTRNQSDLDSARLYAGDVCNNSGLNLLPNYYDLFLSANDNNEESLFALQWEAVNEWGIKNTFQSYVAFEPKITGTGDGWGGGQGASADIIKYYINNTNDAVRRKATYMFNGDHYDEILSKEGGYDYTADWTAAIKKYVVGTPDDNGGKGLNMGTGINSYMLRLAEVYLVYAEAILGNDPSTSDSEALKYFNAVRTRAGLNGLSSITFRDILQEKRIELAMEGNYWYELVRWYYFQPDSAKNYISNQDKGQYSITLNTQGRREFEFPDTLWNGEPIQRTFAVTDKTMWLPLPEVEAARAPNLKKIPVMFDFSFLDDEDE